jgi:hypothetical protein
MTKDFDSPLTQQRIKTKEKGKKEEKGEKGVKEN